MRSVSSIRLAGRLSVVFDTVGQCHQGRCDRLTQAKATVERAGFVVSLIPVRRHNFVVFSAALAGALAWGLA